MDINVAYHIQNWNRVVGPRSKFIRETSTHMIFLHPTKGYREISKKRLMIALA